MKKLLSILVLSLLLSGNAYSKIIKFSKCANERDNFEFRTDLYEKRSYLIDLSKGIVEYVVVLTDSYFKQLVNKNPDSGQPKYIVHKDIIHSYNEYVVVTLKESDTLSLEVIYDLKSKRIQSSLISKDQKLNNSVRFYQCQ